MTSEQIAQCIEAWRLPMLENIILQLEDSFGVEIERHKTEIDYPNVQLFSYAHGILVMKEILCLLKNGFPDGALARARRIYEQMVILIYLELHKNDSCFEQMIVRYFDDQNIRAYFNQVEWCQISNDTINRERCKQDLNAIVQKYGIASYEEKNFRSMINNGYWWTGEDRITFNKLSSCLDDPFVRKRQARPHLCLVLSTNIRQHGRPQKFAKCTRDGFAMRSIG